MKRLSMVIFMCFCLAGGVGAKELDYKKVLVAGTGLVGVELVRYLWIIGGDCIVVQRLVSGGNGRISAEKKFCSIDGKKFDRDFTNVRLWGGSFKDGRLFLDVGITPLKAVDENVMSCEVVFDSGMPDHLSCADKEVHDC